MPIVEDSTRFGRKTSVVVTLVLVLVVIIGAIVASTTADTKTIVRSGIAVVEPDLTSHGLYSDVFLAQGVTESVSYFVNCEQFLASVTTRLAAGYAYRVARGYNIYGQVISCDTPEADADAYIDEGLAWDPEE